ncbi:inositol monophosphatase family protein [Janibacter alittae]|uniref:Inositol monophosphatase n=1 Tax=Janibacter alittae TaxID=3115209 RepID=A0ABZ2MED5_9MICO
MDTLTADIPADVDDVTLALELTRRAARLATRMRAEGLEGARKTSITDVVTAADHAAEELVESALLRLRPQDGIVGEEGAEAESRSGRTWVIDPVDGTYNFLAGLATWCSALALTQEGEVVLGAVHQDAVDESWVGGRDLPARLNGTGLVPLADLPLAEVCLATYLHPTLLPDDDLRGPWLAAVSQAATVRMFGSASCDLAAVAAGRVGVWAQQAVADWDWLPGAALVRAAGGHAEQVEVRGRAWSVAGRPTAVDEVVAALRSA